MFASPFSVLFKIGAYEVKMYGIMMFLAILAGIFVSLFIAKKLYKNISSDTLLDFFPFLILFSILGARLYYVLLNLDYFLKFKSEIFAVWHGGISIHGAILGGIFYSIFYCKKNKIDFLSLMDILSPALALGQAIGRLGNFFNSEAFGLPCNLPWKLYIAPEFRPFGYSDFEFFHPTFLYEMILDVFIFAILLFILNMNKAKNKGLIFFLYLILYGIIRFIIEAFRIDSVLYVFSMPIAQLASIVFFIVGITGFIFVLKKPQK